ncbi:HAMP domain-containing histidine kinase [Halopseudomonas nanhaiensis]|uniref:sensor histidine kinase n=1 Tax=Halopseudomonas nanhaiensis TaxID=2830842 RepID=UPI001CBBD5ED|nr:HAMP domain-containing sensor histidine kinase [Halopseudomonas nanhaiensis]UAW97357.1 HAMP domain-containing histidine kinase [Halopseudomonas nanhaiensis]
MRLFWKVFAVLWLATLLVGGSGFLVSRALQQDWLLLQFHPQLRDFAEGVVTRYEREGAAAAQQWLEEQRREYRLRAQLYDQSNVALLAGTLPNSNRFGLDHAPAEGEQRPRHGRLFQLAWNSGTVDYQLMVYVPPPTLFRWQRTPFALIANVVLAMAVLAIISLLLSRYLTRPLQRLGRAAQALGHGRFEQASLAGVVERRDEIGDLSRSFQSMAGRVQSLLDSQQQLMRDISHELRSPLARLRIGLAIGSKQRPAEDDPLWPRLDRECTRLDHLIDDILTLSRLDTQDAPAQPVELDTLVAATVDDARFAADQQRIELDGTTGCRIDGWEDQLASALDNLLRNALRFSPAEGLIAVSLRRSGNRCEILIRDRGPGVPEDWLGRLGEPFARVAGQPPDSGHGLGLAIARRAIARHNGSLSFTNAPGGGLQVRVALPCGGGQVTKKS